MDVYKNLYPDKEIPHCKLFLFSHDMKLIMCTIEAVYLCDYMFDTLLPQEYCNRKYNWQPNQLLSSKLMLFCFIYSSIMIFVVLPHWRNTSLKYKWKITCNHKSQTLFSGIAYNLKLVQFFVVKEYLLCIQVKQVLGSQFIIFICSVWSFD